MGERRDIKHGPPDRRGDLEKVMATVDFSQGIKEGDLRFSLEKACENIDMTGLPHDVINNFYPLSLAIFIDDEESANKLLKPLPSYKEYLRTQMPEAAVSFIGDYSDHGKVNEFDQLVEVINGDLERIKKDKDFSQLKKYVQAATHLIKGK